VLLCALTAGARGEPGDPDNDLIRAFLQSPPTLCSYQFELLTHPAIDGNKISPQFVRGRWNGAETNWVQIIPGQRFATNPASGYARSLFRGRLGSLYWHSQNGAIGTWDENWNTNRAEPDRLVAVLATHPPSLLLRLGLNTVDFATARWAGDHFDADAGFLLDTPDEKRWSVTGLIRKRGPSEWELFATNAATRKLETQAIVRGGKDADGTFRPEEIVVFKWVDKTEDITPKGWVKLTTSRILEFEVHPGGVSTNSFHPLTMAEIRPTSFSFYTNDVLYAFNEFEMKKLYTAGNAINYAGASRVWTIEEVRKFQGSTYTKPTLLTLIALGLIASIFLFVRMSRGGKHQYNNS